MPGIITQPNIIEQSDFMGGWSPDGEDVTTDPNVLLDTLNVLPDVNTHSLRARPGFARLLDELDTEVGGRYIVSLFHFFAGVQHPHYLIAITTNGLSASNNVRVYAIDLDALTATRIDSPTTTNWANPTKPHWGVAIDKVWYGGSQGNDMYSWDPDGPTWTANAASGNFKTLVDDVDSGVDTDTEYGRDFAFTGKERVTYNGDTYQANKHIRYDTWESGQRYVVGDRVSIQRAWGQSGTPKYWKSWRCVQAHVADATNRPGDGSGSPGDYWKKVRLPLPQDDSGDTADSWNFVPVAAQTSVACWHADRLFMRFDGQGDKSRVLYSAPVKPEKGEDVPDVVWDPTDFAPATNFGGSGGGWIPFNDGKHHGVVENLFSYGQYLMVFKRRNVFVLAGTDESTWTPRHIAGEIGTMGPNTAVECNGLVYFLSDDGLYVTDGTSVQPAPGNEKVQRYIRDRLDESMQLDDDLDPQLCLFDGFVFISLPDSAASDEVTLVYEPESGSFWKTSLPILAATVYRDEGISKMAFGPTPTYNDRSMVMGYDQGDDRDDTGDSLQVFNPISWLARTAWWPFGTLHEERRIRRVWAVVKGALTFTLKARRDWDDSVVKTTTRDGEQDVATHIEGEWFADSHAVNFEVSGEEAPAALYGIAVHTEPRRVRYHN